MRRVGEITVGVVYFVTLTSLPLVFGQLQLQQNRNDYQVVVGYKQLDFKFPSAEVREKQIKSGEFIPENNLFSGVKIFGERIFLAVPRLWLGVPSTLNFIKFNSKKTEEEVNRNEAAPHPPLEPYPSWEMQKIGNCSALQNSQSMEIDEFGRLWVFDSGRINTFAEDPTEHQNFCSAKLLIFDLASDKLLLKYEFPPEVVSFTTNWLNDITVGCDSGSSKGKGQQNLSKNDPSNCWAYLTDSGDAKMIIFSLKQKRSWFVRHNQTMGVNPEAVNIPVLGEIYTIRTKINGITLSPKDSNHDRVYYAPMSSYAMNSVSSSILQASKNGDNLKDSDVTVHNANRSSQSDGITMDSEGILIYGVLQNNSVAVVDTEDPDGFQMETEIIKNDEELQWPNSFSFDDEGYLYTATIKANFLNNSLNLNEINFRIVRSFVGSKSYAHSSIGNKNIYGNQKKIEEEEEEIATTNTTAAPQQSESFPNEQNNQQLSFESYENFKDLIDQSLSHLENEEISEELPNVARDFGNVSWNNTIIYILHDLRGFPIFI